jgi:hypothetical protein
MIACYEQIMKGMKSPSCRQTSLLDFFVSSQGTNASPSVLLDVGHDDPEHRRAVPHEVFP